MIINARPTYWESGHVREKYLHRVSSRVRGEEVANYLGWEMNKEGSPCIWLKPRHLTNVKDGDYVDVLDDTDVIPLLVDRPKIKVISMSLVHHEYLKSILKNDITLIYHHHITFDWFS